MNDNPKAEPAAPALAEPKIMSAAAQRALAEAEARRAQEAAQVVPKEFNGRPGPEPVRYGDWENKGIASDF